jgi:phosphinothricin acetyltransferase
MAELISRAKAQHFHIMVGVIDAANRDSIAFHKKFGFVEAGVWNEVGFKFGRWLDVQFMQLALD